MHPLDAAYFDALSPADNAAPFASAVFVFAVLPLLLLGASLVALVYLLRARRRARTAPHSAPGHAVVSGVVVCAEEEGAEPPVVVAIRQVGREWTTKNGKQHKWREVSRAVSARPFYVRDAAGRETRVEPDERVFVVDAMDTVTAHSYAERTVMAQVTPGETVHVVGVLTQGFDPRGGGSAAAGSYRAGGASLVLVPPSGGRMLVSTEPLDKRFAQRGTFHLGWLLTLVVALGLLEVCNAGYFSLLVHGHVVTATVTEHRTWVTEYHDKNGTHYSTHHALSAASQSDGAPTRLVFQEEVTAGDYAALPDGAAVPFVVDQGAAPAQAQLGTRPSINSLGLGLELLVALGLLVGYAISARATLPWYDRRRVIHAGGGSLVAGRL